MTVRKQFRSAFRLCSFSHLTTLARSIGSRKHTGQQRPVPWYLGTPRTWCPSAVEVHAWMLIHFRRLRRSLHVRFRTDEVLIGYISGIRAAEMCSCYTLHLLQKPPNPPLLMTASHPNPYSLNISRWNRTKTANQKKHQDGHEGLF